MLFLHGEPGWPQTPQLRYFNADLAKDVILVGFSYGSVIGLKLAEQYPDDYYAYIGIAQVISVPDSWDVSIQWLKEQAQQKDDAADLKKLALLEEKDESVCPTILDCFMGKYELVIKYGGLFSKRTWRKKLKKQNPCMQITENTIGMKRLTIPRHAWMEWLLPQIFHISMN